MTGAKRLVLVLTMLGAWVAASYAQEPPKALIAGTVPLAEFLEREPTDWRVGCVTDEVTTVRHCFARTIGWSYMSYHDDELVFINMERYIFVVEYFDDLGPLSGVGIHTFPGKQPMVRVDEGEPMIVEDDGGVSSRKAQPEIAQQMLKGELLRGRYYEWPDDYPKRLLVDLRAFDDAWERLQAELKEAE